ncbi:MAG: prevent-host-death protein [Pyrinomonadaceae bacterium]
MKSLSVGEIKAQFSKLLEEVQNGETIEILYGKKRNPIARIVPIKGSKRKKKRKIGILDGKMKIVFAEDFKMTEEKFINM